VSPSLYDVGADFSQNSFELMDENSFTPDRHREMPAVGVKDKEIISKKHSILHDETQAEEKSIAPSDVIVPFPQTQQKVSVPALPSSTDASQSRFVNVDIGESATTAKLLVQTQDLESKSAAAEKGTVEWCCALTFCSVETGPARPNLHRCTKCGLKMHVICGVPDQNDEDSRVCYECVYITSDIVPDQDPDQLAQQQVKVPSNNNASNSKFVIVGEEDLTGSKLSAELLLKTYGNAIVKFTTSPSLDNSHIIKKVCDRIFGTYKVTLNTLYSMATFLEEAYLHDDANPIFGMLRIEQQETGIVTAYSEAINVMRILLMPQKSSDKNLDIPDIHLETDKPKYPFIYKSLRFKVGDDPSNNFPINGFISEEKLGLKSILKNKWIGLNHTCNLPFMYFSQPIGFTLMKSVPRNKIFVYIYLSLLPNINSRRLTSDNERLNHQDDVKGIVTNMSSNEISKDATRIDSNRIILHPIQIKEKTDVLTNPKDLYITSPLADNAPASMPSGLPGSNDRFANGKFVASHIPPDVMIESMIRLLGIVELDDVFTNIPSEMDIHKMGSLSYSMVLYINLCNALNKRYSDFTALNCYVQFFDDMNENIVKNRSDVPTTLTRKHLEGCNVYHICRLLFRFLCGNIGIMIPEGNGRNYSACLAYTRCTSSSINMYLNDSIDNKKALNEPNLNYISPHIICDYIIHKHDDNVVYPFPYEKNKTMYFNLSRSSYNDSKASQSMSCRDFAERFFSFYVDKSNSENPNEDYIPYEIRQVWPFKFKQESEKFLEDTVTVKEKTKKKTGLDSLHVTDKTDTKENTESKGWAMFALNKWLSERKRVFFEQLCKNDDIMQHVKSEFKQWNREWNEKARTGNVDGLSKDDAFLNHLCTIYEENVSSDFFQRMNIIRMMSLYLSGLICSAKNDCGELFLCLRSMLRTNGVVPSTTNNNADNNAENLLTTSLHCAWVEEEYQDLFPLPGTYKVSSVVNTMRPFHKGPIVWHL
jgi:hypothetical protein